jgi:hypothetical protein
MDLHSLFIGGKNVFGRHCVMYEDQSGQMKRKAILAGEVMI